MAYAKQTKRTKESVRKSVRRCMGDPKWKQRLPGGTRKHPSDFDITALVRGAAVELEHTTDPCIAMEIAMDHLNEDDLYYEKLALIENPIVKKLAAEIRRSNISTRPAFREGQLLDIDDETVRVEHTYSLDDYWVMEVTMSDGEGGTTRADLFRLADGSWEWGNGRRVQSIAPGLAINPRTTRRANPDGRARSLARKLARGD